MDMLANISLGIGVALSGTNLFYCFLGVVVGTVIGVIPGVGAISAISLLLPVTFYLDPTTALIMLGGIWYGATYGGSTAAILLNIPGTPANAVTCMDGYPLARQGRGGVALLMAALASFTGGTIGIIILMFFSPLLASYALSFGAAEYFALMFMGLVAASTITDGSAVKGLAMVTLGILFGCVGADIYTGVPRFNFGTLELQDTISLVALAMGVFGVSEVIATVRNVHVSPIDRSSVSFRAMRPTGEELRRAGTSALRGSGIGSFFGALPGAGPSIAAFIAYAFEKKVSPRSKLFGKGAVEGIAAPESANNAADQTAFIPTLSLGIPGSPTMALMLGALMIHGIAPGPGLVVEQPSLFWGLIMSFWIGNLMLVILNVPMIGLWVRLLTIPYHLLYPAVLVFICIGTYSVHQSAFEVGLVAFFGALGYLMRVFDWPAAPLLLGFVLGPMMEEHFRRAMLFSRGDVLTFFERPISATVMAIAILMLVWGVISTIRQKRRARLEE
ncbi:tripartite tricarboxylate transporter permease [Pararhodobacter sp. CCB-MM2]|uniref:tripartite tricarboxylate transporter permease n=1 Tax=Pararhodobacter sp. CCB-MM2 TaxID=1786003 RepID=UPI00082EEEE5|nr:tripartite tricarboxylate transporter permease [Pararhodobacter sp. CCB-MM2]